MKPVNRPVFWCVGPHRSTDCEDQAACSSIVGRKVFVRRSADLRRIWPGCWGVRLLCSAASPTAGRLLRAAISRPRVHVDRRLLVSGWTALALACRLLGPAAVRRRLLGDTALLRAPLLGRLLAALARDCRSSQRLSRKPPEPGCPPAGIAVYCCRSHQSAFPLPCPATMMNSRRLSPN